MKIKIQLSNMSDDASIEHIISVLQLAIEKSKHIIQEDKLGSATMMVDKDNTMCIVEINKKFF